MATSSRTIRILIGATMLAGVSAFAAPSFAQDDFKSHFMGQWDLNSDGKITLDEITEQRGNVFASFDANEDGYLDATEQAAMGEMRDATHDGMDSGRKGPGNGQGQGNGQGKGMGQGMGQGMKMQQAAENGMHSSRMLDTDGDGKISKDEFVSFSGTWLARMDQNGDNEITDADF